MEFKFLNRGSFQIRQNVNSWQKQRSYYFSSVPVGKANGSIRGHRAGCLRNVGNGRSYRTTSVSDVVPTCTVICLTIIDAFYSLDPSTESLSWF